MALFFAIIFTTAFFQFIINAIAGNNLSEESYNTLLQYRILVTGLAYMLVAYFLSSTARQFLTGILYSLGALAFLISALALGGFFPDQNIFWELVFPLLVFGMIFASVMVKSRSLLFFGTLFLIVYIFKLTAEYFRNSLGWPLALVLAGMLIIAVGFYAVKINRKYLKN